jgi:aminomethyltransferase
MRSKAALGAGEGRPIRFDFMGKSRLFFAISGVILLIGALGIAIQGLNFGMDFEVDDDHTPLDAGLGWAVKLDNRDFIGASVLRAQKQNGVTRQLVGFKIAESERAIARHGYAVVDRAATPPIIGTVTSGGPGIFVGGAIGLAYVPTAKAAAGTQLTIDCRGKDVPATVVSGKFYKRS